MKRDTMSLAQMMARSTPSSAGRRYRAARGNRFGDTLWAAATHRPFSRTTNMPMARPSLVVSSRNQYRRRNESLERQQDGLRPNPWSEALI
jgi:hypothetical protein